MWRAAVQHVKRYDLMSQRQYAGEYTQLLLLLRLLQDLAVCLDRPDSV